MTTIEPPGGKNYLEIVPPPQQSVSFETSNVNPVAESTAIPPSRYSEKISFNSFEDKAEILNKMYKQYGAGHIGTFEALKLKNYKEILTYKINKQTLNQKTPQEILHEFYKAQIKLEQNEKSIRDIGNILKSTVIISDKVDKDLGLRYIFTPNPFKTKNNNFIETEYLMVKTGGANFALSEDSKFTNQLNSNQKDIFKKMGDYHDPSYKYYAPAQLMDLSLFPVEDEKQQATWVTFTYKQLRDFLKSEKYPFDEIIESFNAVDRYTDFLPNDEDYNPNNIFTLFTPESISETIEMLDPVWNSQNQRVESMGWEGFKNRNYDLMKDTGIKKRKYRAEIKTSGTYHRNKTGQDVFLKTTPEDRSVFRLDPTPRELRESKLAQKNDQEINTRAPKLS
ncbi:MAG: hypothetical protein HRT47_11380 [Candidatus Caenarcaniphilales bacterium]|nr:hypothetical protein [Candidatus Caenarcaniphilales bacterium]